MDDLDLQVLSCGLGVLAKPIDDRFLDLLVAGVFHACGQLPERLRDGAKGIHDSLLSTNSGHVLRSDLRRNGYEGPSQLRSPRRRAQATIPSPSPIEGVPASKVLLSDECFLALLAGRVLGLQFEVPVAVSASGFVVLPCQGTGESDDRDQGCQDILVPVPARSVDDRFPSGGADPVDRRRCSRLKGGSQPQPTPACGSLASWS